MLETVDLKAKLTKAEYKGIADPLDLRLAELQRRLLDAEIPVIIVFEGWDASGKGTAIGRLLRGLDPRGYKVHKPGPPTEDAIMRPPMWRYWQLLPPHGRIALYDRSWYSQVLDDRVFASKGDQSWADAYQRIRTFERQLVDDHAVVIKFWLHISKKEQKKRFKKLADDPVTAWRVSAMDRKRHKRYDRFTDAVEDMLRETSTASAPWTVIPAHDRRYAHVRIGETVAAAMENALTRKHSEPAPIAEVHLPNRRTSPLDRVDLSLSIARDTYRDQLRDLQKELHRIEHRMYVERIPAMIVFEGWDAAGKGGCIRRMVRDLDPRGFEVAPYGAPEGEEKHHHYLWRFWRNIPKAGHLTIFDRSWYGRVLVERVEGFATPEEWQRAYREINEFEQELAQFGMVIVKFWMHISKDEQLNRFKSREETPHKEWKITDEDWRNRERWDAYWQAVSDMIERTSTPDAPWTIVEGDDKPHARIKTLETVITAIGQTLDNA